MNAHRTRSLVTGAAVTLVLLVGVSAAHAQVDLEAERAYLRTEPNAGNEVGSPALGQQIYFHLDYNVAGSGEVFEAQVSARIDGEEHCGGVLQFTPGEVSVIWCPGPWTATAGNHTMRWEIDANQTVAEVNENNNVAERMFPTGASVDMHALEAYMRTAVNDGEEVALPAVGQQVYFHVDYQVTGSGEPFEAEVSARIDGEEHCGGVLQFTPGEASVLFCPNAWTATAGVHTLRWDIDSGNVVAEPNESDNVAQVTFGCTGDCSGDGQVAINELVTGVDIALGNQAAGSCPAFDKDRDDKVAINELIAAVNNALSGCF